MAKDPAVLFFIDKWLVATKGMKADCRGWFLNLILHQFDKGELPNDIEELANYADVRISEFERFKQVFEQVLKHKFEQNENGCLENSIAKEILRGREQFKEKRENAGKLSYFLKYVRANLCKDENIIHAIKARVDLSCVDIKKPQQIEHVFKQVLKQVSEQKSELYINTNENVIVNKIEVIKNEIESLILENEEGRISANTLADYFSKWLTQLEIKNKREYTIKNHGQRDDRFDLMVFNEANVQVLIIEVKNYTNHDDYYKPLKQIERYSKHNLPILFVPNFRTAYDRLVSCFSFIKLGQYDKSFVFIPNSQPVGVIPQMVQIFKNQFPKYFSIQQNDYPATREIAEKVVEWQGLIGDITDAHISDSIKLRWGELVKHIASHNHYRDYDLAKINKYFQSIVQSFNSPKNGTHSKALTGKPVIQTVTEGGFGQL